MEHRCDYLILGAGSAGATLANRLSEDGQFSVCLLEAGPKANTPLVSIPGAFAAFMFSKTYNWALNAEPVADIRDGRPMFCPRGKGLGGSSSINAMVYIRGHHSDYDAWAAEGNAGWDFAHMLPYFKRAESNRRGGDVYHGHEGPLVVSDIHNYYPLNKAFLTAAKQAGFPLTNDFNGAQFEGAGFFQFTIEDGRRCGVKRAYLRPAMRRQNLDVFVGAHITKILFKGDTAIGAEFVRNGRICRVFADKEVILSAGAIGSPQLLQLSGVGDEQHLRSLGIEPVHVLAGVGKNLQEHVDACVLQRSLKTDGFTTSAKGLLQGAMDALEYMISRRGRLANSITQAGAFIRSHDDIEVPDVQLHFLPLLYNDDGRDLNFLRQHGYSCHACVLRPKSRGDVLIRSSDPTAAPAIRFNFFDHPDDAKTLIDGIRQVRRIFAQDAFAEYRGEELAPGDDAQTDEQILQQAKRRLGTVYHPTSTCKMGSDELCVVDSELRVHGLRNLRVVDASIMPNLISGNTNAPTIAIAEKAADMILGRGALAPELAFV